MGFVFAVLGAILGSWMAAGDEVILGLGAGFVIGWLSHRLVTAQAKIRNLESRVGLLEQRNEATAAAEKVSKKSFPTTERVSIYEPEPVEQPQAASAATSSDSESPESPEPASPPPKWTAPEPARASEPRTKTPAKPARPSMGAHTIDVAKRWLTTGNVPVKMGVLLSFFGVAFLLKYAIENQVFSIPISARYLGVAAFAAGLLAFGWRKRKENRVFALSIQGGGIGVLFLTVFAAFRLHGLLSPTVAFVLLVLITAAAGYLAIRQESRALAILGTTGGFLAPLLASTGSGNHVALFSYYLVLNCAVLGVAWYRPWRELNIIGFVFTFGVGTLWGHQYYLPELFNSTEPFLVLYFLFYTAIAVLFAFRQRPELRGYVDGTLLFGTPTIAFALQSELVGHTEYGLAISAAVLAMFYGATALWLRQRKDQDFGLLTQVFIALGVAFATIAIPLALDDRWTAIAWALEGAGLVWVGVRQNTTLAKITGTALAFAAGAEFMQYGWTYDLGMPVFNGNFMGCVLIAATSLYSSRLLLTDEDGRDWQGIASVGLLVWGLLWWFGGGYSEIADRATQNSELNIAVAFLGASFVTMLFAANRLRWLALWTITLGLLPFAAGAALVGYGWTDDLGIAVLNGNVLGGALIAWISLYSSRQLATDERATEMPAAVSLALLAWGVLFWFGTGALEISDRVPDASQLHALLLFGSLSLSGFAFAGWHFGWIAYRRISLALLPALGLMSLVYLVYRDHFFFGLGSLAWPVAIASHVWILYCYDRVSTNIERIWHSVGAVLFAYLVAYELAWQLDRTGVSDTWSQSAALLVLALTGFVFLLERNGKRWPFDRHWDAYFFAAVTLIVSYTAMLIVYCIDWPGDPAPLPYIPLINPFDTLSIIAMALLWYVMKLERANPHISLLADSRKPAATYLSIGFLLSTLSVVRLVHHITGVQWESGALMNSVSVQSTLSIYWAILGLSGMVLGTRRENRSIWLAGAGLMVVVVLKLFVIDLGNTGTVARIVSFLGVGVMLLVVGYFSPVPPRADEADKQ